MSELMDVAGRALREALLAGRADPATLAALATRRRRPKLPLREPALTGLVHDHPRQWLARPRAPSDVLEAPLEARTRAMVASRKAFRTAEPPREAPHLCPLSGVPRLSRSLRLSPCPVRSHGETRGLGAIHAARR